MSSDEEDYMSDAFLQKCGDSRPGLAPKQAQRLYKKEKAQKQANKNNTFIPKQKLEATNREVGLKTSISSESKGFALLQKMGYKPGMGIGKHGTGQVEPVPIELKGDRSGLGRESEMKRKATEMNNMRTLMAAKRKKAEEKRKETFMDRLKERFSGKTTERDLRTAQKACLQLDQQQGISLPEQQFFWPANSLPSLKEADDDSENEEGQKGYITKPQNNEDSDDEYYDDDNAVDDSIEFSDFEKLDILTRYLRNVYQYCIWCGTKYNDKSDLDSNCPGNASESHD